MHEFTALRSGGSAPFRKIKFIHASHPFGIGFHHLSGPASVGDKLACAVGVSCRGREGALKSMYAAHGTRATGCLNASCTANITARERSSAPRFARTWRPPPAVKSSASRLTRPPDRASSATPARAARTAPW